MYGITEDLLLNHISMIDEPCDLKRMLLFWDDTMERNLVVPYLIATVNTHVNTGRLIKTIIGQKEYYKISQKGLDYLEANREGVRRDKESEELTLTKLRYDVKNSKRIYSTYWFTFAAAIIGLIVACISLYLNFKRPK